MNIAAERWRFGRQVAPAGGEIAIAGIEAVCDPLGALYLPAERLLVVSDLHLEKGAHFARRGRMLPPYDTATTLALLERAIATWHPRTVVSLGDSFHDGKGAALMAQPYRDRLAALAGALDWIWITGNHDPDAPCGLPGVTAHELCLGPLTLRHEPSRGEASGEIAGHLHPGGMIVERGRAVRRRCFASDGSRLIMPAFGAYTGMLNILDRAYRGLFCQDRLVAHMMGADRVYAIARRRLRAGR